MQIQTGISTYFFIYDPWKDRLLPWKPCFDPFAHINTIECLKKKKENKFELYPSCIAQNVPKIYSSVQCSLVVPITPFFSSGFEFSMLGLLRVCTTCVQKQPRSL